ncbi:MAG: hypothetical protein ACRETN_12670 [Nevskiales bacterium]
MEAIFIVFVTIPLPLDLAGEMERTFVNRKIDELRVEKGGGDLDIKSQEVQEIYSKGEEIFDLQLNLYVGIAAIASCIAVFVLSYLLWGLPRAEIVVVGGYSLLLLYSKFIHLEFFLVVCIVCLLAIMVPRMGR